MAIYLVALRLVVVDFLLSKSPTSFQLNHSSGDIQESRPDLILTRLA